MQPVAERGLTDLREHHACKGKGYLLQGAATRKFLMGNRSVKTPGRTRELHEMLMYGRLCPHCDADRCEALYAYQAHLCALPFGRNREDRDHRLLGKINILGRPAGLE